MVFQHGLERALDKHTVKLTDHQELYGLRQQTFELLKLILNLKRAATDADFDLEEAVEKYEKWHTENPEFAKRAERWSQRLQAARLQPFHCSPPPSDPHLYWSHAVAAVYWIAFDLVDSALAVMTSPTDDSRHPPSDPRYLICELRAEDGRVFPLWTFPKLSIQEMKKNLKEDLVNFDYAFLCAEVDYECDRAEQQLNGSQEGKPGRPPYPVEAHNYARQLKKDGLSLSQIMEECVNKFGKDNVPYNTEAIRKWLSREPKERRNPF